RSGRSRRGERRTQGWRKISARSETRARCAHGRRYRRRYRETCGEVARAGLRDASSKLSCAHESVGPLDRTSCGPPPRSGEDLMDDPRQADMFVNSPIQAEMFDAPAQVERKPIHSKRYGIIEPPPPGGHTPETIR